MENQIQSPGAVVSPDFSVRFEGVPVTLGGTRYTVPPLSLKQVRLLTPILESFRTVTVDNFDANSLDALMTVIHAALSRNYPNISRDDLEELVDMGNAGALMAAVLGASGLSGNALALAMIRKQSLSTGAESTAT